MKEPVSISECQPVFGMLKRELFCSPLGLILHKLCSPYAGCKIGTLQVFNTH